MHKRIILSLAALSAMSGLVSTAALAQAPAAEVPGHPRVSEVDQRIENQQKRIDQGVNNGTINAKQEMRDENRLNKVGQELSADEAKNGGHITKAEQRKMNRQLNRNSRKIHRQKHHAAATASSSGGAQ